jgi:hypothetical protein
MAPPLTGKNLILHPPSQGEGSMKRILCSLLQVMVEAGELNPLLPATERFVDLLERLKLLKRLELSFLSVRTLNC